MDILGIGPLELVIVFIIILLILGPNEMVKTGKTLGEFFRKVTRSDEWRGLNKITREIRTLPNRLAREAELENLKNEIDLDQQISPIANELKASASAALEDWETTPEKPDKTDKPEDSTKQSNQEDK